MSTRKVDSGENTVEENNSGNKSWFSSIQNFNDKIAQLVAFNTKLLMFVMLIFFIYLILASILQGETFSVNELNVHPSIEEKGYNSAFIAKKISYDIATIVNEVPDKLFAMFSAGVSREKNEILYQRIVDKYVKKEIKIDMDVNVGGVSIPLRRLTKTARSAFGVENKSLDGDLTVEDDLLIMTLGLNSNGINKGYQSIKYHYNPSDSAKVFDIIEVVTKDAARFVLSKYDPLVTLLIDFNPDLVYSSRDSVWKERVYKDHERLKILKELYLNDKKDLEMAIWAHAITGAIYFEKFGRLELSNYKSYSIYHFKKAIEMNPSFVDIVGMDLASIYLDSEDSASINEGINTYEEMIWSDPMNIEIHTKLIKIYAKQENTMAYYRVLEDAFKHGLYLSDRDLKRSQYKAYRDQDKFNTLLSKYNEKNKPLI